MRPSLSVSVIIPAYNSSNTILRALDSVLNQSLQPQDVIVVDDGSKDNTCDLIEKHFPNVKLIKQKNAGAAAARNAGAKIAGSDLMAFLDSDDFWHSRKLEYQLSIFEQFPEIGICSTSCVFLRETPNLNNKDRLCAPLTDGIYKRIKFNQVFSHPYLGTPSVMMRKSLFQILEGFDESLETAEDVDLWLKASYHSSYLLIENPLTYVVEQKESLSTRANMPSYESHLVVLDRFGKNYKLSILFKLFRLTKAKANIYCYWGSTLLVNRQYLEARKKLMQSFFMFPSFRAFYLIIKTII